MLPCPISVYVVTDIFSLNKEAEVLRLAYSIENLSEHPLARAVVQKAEESGLTPLKAKDFQALTGAGAKAKIDGEDFYIGNPLLAVLIPAALTGVMSVALAVFVHEGSELLAVTNGLRVGKD